MNVSPSNDSFGKRELLGPAGDELHTVRDTVARHVLLAAAQHGLGEVDAHDVRGRAVGQLERDAGGTCGDIEHTRRSGRHDVVDHDTPPTPVLTEREDRLEQVVTLRKSGEQLACELVRIRERLPSPARPRGSRRGHPRTVRLPVEGEGLPDTRFDVLVVGAGPAGSVAAVVLARGGARVAVVDKASFPRDKACGDLVGPRGVQLLSDLAIELPCATTVDDMIVVGPTGRRVRLPCYPGTTYPGYALASPRASLDTTLREAAVRAGAVPFVGRAAEPLVRDSSLDGFVLSSGERVRADVVIGADGATSHVAEVAGLVESPRVLWGFALRAYLADPVLVPHIVLWEPTAWRAFPGYGWLFPGVDGRANVGLGLGVLGDRRAGARATQDFGAFLDHLWRLGVLSARVPPSAVPNRLGGWLKLGMVGTTPARDRVLLVGDAAGLVNPLQGEGIAQGMQSGRAAAEAVLADPAAAATRYRAFLAAAFGPYQSAAAPAHAALLPRPRTTAAVGRLLTAPGVGRAVAGGWSIFWNDLVDGATPRRARTLASAVTRVGRVAMSQTRTGRWFTGLPP